MSSSTTNPAPAATGNRPRRGPGVPTGFVAAAVAVVLGVAGLIVGARDDAGQSTPGAIAI